MLPTDLAAELARDKPDDGPADDAADAEGGRDDGPQVSGLGREWFQEWLGAGRFEQFYGGNSIAKTCNLKMQPKMPPNSYG